MLGERKSFHRFLVVYISSSLFLLGIGIWFYYKMSYQMIISSNVSQIKKEIALFIEKNQNNHFLRTRKHPQYLDAPIAIYINNLFKFGSFTPKEIDLKKEKFIHDAKVYYVLHEYKRWGKISFVSYKDISNEVEKLQIHIALFLSMSTVFIIIIAFVLGRIFLRPMKDTIESLEEFIADTTHEINTPLSNILINIELAQELYPICKESEEFNKIQNSAFRISKLFRDLSFVRFKHKRKIVLEVLHLDEVIEERLQFFSSFIKNKKIYLMKDIKPMDIKIDREDIIRIVDNLLSNAIKYSPEKENLLVKLSLECLEVINSGEIKNTKRVLEKFVRDNKNEGGFGLGLYIVQKICDNYGYKFSLSSFNGKIYSKVYFRN